MATQVSWAAWNRRFEQWTLAQRRHVELQAQAQVLASIDPCLAAKATEVAALQWAVAQTAQQRMRMLMLRLLLNGPALSA